MIDPTRYQVLTFDCYGTLVDWETGIADALGEIASRHGVSLGREELLALYAAFEPAAQSGAYRSYRDVLADVTGAFADEIGISLGDTERAELAESIAQWPVFGDTRRSLARLASCYDLAILSNVDHDLFELTYPSLIADGGFDFATVITAEDTQSYKPAIGHFWHAIETMGIPGAQILHVAQSLFHDIVPAQSMGISTVWVNRRGDAPGSGATPEIELPSNVGPDLEVPDLRSLADLLVG